MKIESLVQEKFEPKKIVLTIETQEEFNALYALGNSSERALEMCLNYHGAKVHTSALHSIIAMLFNCLHSML